MHWISEEDKLPEIGRPVLLCAPRQHEEFWDMRVYCILVRHEGVFPRPVKAGGEWPTEYYWGDPYYPNIHKLITGNAWWSSFEGIELPPRAMHRCVGPRNDPVILQDGDVWVGRMAAKS